MTRASIPDSTVARHRALLDLEARRLGHLAHAVPSARTPILLKGPTVRRHYREPSRRTYRDIDILVPFDDVPIWEGLLETAGYGGPSRRERGRALRYHHHLTMRRETQAGSLPVEIHWALSIARRARHVDYDAVAPRCAPDADFGLLVPEPAALLVVLAIHLANHAPAHRSPKWYRDFLEIGTPDRIEQARSLATLWRVEWALEEALGAVRIQSSRASLVTADVPPKGGAGVRRHLALARDFGVVGGTRYVASRLDPRRLAERRRERRPLAPSSDRRRIRPDREHRGSHEREGGVG